MRRATEGSGPGFCWLVVNECSVGQRVKLLEPGEKDEERVQCATDFISDMFHNNNNNKKLQLGCHPVAVVILHLYKI